MFTDLSVVIPYRADQGYRDRLCQWTLNRYAALFPGADIILGEMACERPLFCRSEAINNGVSQSSRDILLIADADVLAMPEAIREAIDVVKTGEASWVFPYHDYWELNEPTTAQLLERNPADPVNLSKEQCVGIYGNSTASLVVLDRPTFWSVGGFDERFVGWAPEDQAWAYAMQTLMGEPARIDTVNLYHLWHPVLPGTTTDNPHYSESDALWQKYREALENPERMRALVDEVR